MITGVMASASTAALGSAFQLFEQNGAGVGDYHAGGAAEADDASTEYYNPAGLVRIKDEQLVAGGVIIPVDVKFHGDVGNVSTNGDRQGGTFNIIPNMHYSAPLSERWVLGFGITTPFGLATDWPQVPPIEQAATRTKLQTININPNVAFAVTPWFSLGAGLDAQYGKADFDEISLNLIDDENELSGWAYGWNAGALLQWGEHTRAGVSYRSRITYHADGTSTYDVSALAGGGSGSGSITSTLRLPSTTIFSVYQDLSEKLAVVASAYYTQWNVMNEIKLQNVPLPPVAGGNVTDLTLPTNYRNTWNFAAGVHYWLDDKMMLKTGFGHDQTPTNNTDRDLRLPDEDRWAMAFGAHYQAWKPVAFDIGWTHFLVKNAPISNKGPIEQPITTRGTARMHADVLGAQVTWDINA